MSRGVSAVDTAVAATLSLPSKVSAGGFKVGKESNCDDAGDLSARPWKEDGTPLSIGSTQLSKLPAYFERVPAIMYTMLAHSQLRYL